MGLDPGSWDPEVFLAAASWIPRPTATGRTGVSAQHALTAQAGFEALRAGGTAADAIVAMVAVDCVVQPGTCSLAGSLGGLYATGDGVISLNAGMNRPLRHRVDYNHRRDRATGHAVLVPGCVAGLEALWARYGRLDWKQLWSPALFFASEGFPISVFFQFNAARRASVLLASPSARSCLASDGTLPAAGDRLRQPALADTISKIASGGAQWFSQTWAAQACEAVERAGGALSAADFETYQIRWQTPLSGSYLGQRIQVAPPPHYGGPVVLAALGVAEQLDVHRRNPREGDGIALAHEIAALGAAWTAYPPHDPRTASKEMTERAAYALATEFARAAADRILHRSLDTPCAHGPHSHQLAAADEYGAAASISHTIQSDSWGDTGIFVGGVALNSSAFEVNVAPGPPGTRVVEPFCNFALHLPRGQVLGGAISGGTLAACLQIIIDLAGHDRTLDDAINHPRWGQTEFDLETFESTETVTCEAFPPEVFAAARTNGASLTSLADGATHVDVGYAAAVQQTANGELTISADPRIAGTALSQSSIDGL